MRGLLAAIGICIAMPACVSPERLVLPVEVADDPTRLLVWKSANSVGKLRVLGRGDDVETLNLRQESGLWLITLEYPPEFYQLPPHTNVSWGDREVEPLSVHRLVGGQWDDQNSVLPSGFGLPGLNLERCLEQQGCLRNPVCEGASDCSVVGPTFCDDPCEPQAPQEMTGSNISCPPDWLDVNKPFSCTPPDDDRQACGINTWRPFLGGSCESIWSQTPPPLPAAPVVYVDNQAPGGAGCGGMANPCRSFDELGPPTGDRVIMMTGQHSGRVWMGPGITVVRGTGPGAVLTGSSTIAAGKELVVQQLSVAGGFRGLAGSRIEIVQSSLHSAQGPAIEVDGVVTVEESRISAVVEAKNCGSPEALRSCVRQAVVVVRDAAELRLIRSEIHGDTAVLTQRVDSVVVEDSRIIAEQLPGPMAPLSPTAGLILIDTPAVQLDRNGIYGAYLPGVYVDTIGLASSQDVDLNELLIWRDYVPMNPNNPDDDTRSYLPSIWLRAEEAHTGHAVHLSKIYGGNVGQFFLSSEVTSVSGEDVFVENGRGGFNISAFQAIDVELTNVALDLNQNSALSIAAEGAVELNNVHFEAPRKVEQLPEPGFAGVSGSRRVSGAIHSVGLAGGVPTLIAQRLTVKTARTAAIRGFFRSVELYDTELRTSGDWIFDTGDGLPNQFALELTRVSMLSDVAGLRIPDVALNARGTILAVGNADVPAPAIGPAVCASVKRSVEFTAFWIAHSHPEEGLLWFFGDQEERQPLLSEGRLTLGHDFRMSEPAARLARKVDGCTTGTSPDDTSVTLRVHNVQLVKAGR